MPIFYPNTRRTGYGPWPHFRVITIKELEDRALVIAIRKSCFHYSSEHWISPYAMLDELVELYSRMKVMMVDANGHPVALNTGVFEATEDEILFGNIRRIVERRVEFFDYNACTAPNENGGFVHPDWRAQFAVMGSIIGAAMMDESRAWPRRRVVRPLWELPTPANDNRRK